MLGKSSSRAHGLEPKSWLLMNQKRFNVGKRIDPTQMSIHDMWAAMSGTPVPPTHWNDKASSGPGADMDNVCTK